MPIDKAHFVKALRTTFEEQLGIARRAAKDAGEAAATLATESEKREDSRVALEFGSLSAGQAARAQKAREELERLDHFMKQGLTRYGRRTPVGLGALVDVHMETHNGEEERTFFLMPVGAGTELLGPGGDGFVSVITPASPVGKQLLGRLVGESVDVTVKDETYEWTITDVG